MRVGIYSNNAQVNTTIVSMCASNGCKIKKILKYDRINFKGCDLVIIDLDNCEDGKQFLENDISNMPEVVFVGISKSLDIVDNYRGIMNVERKPFNSKEFRIYQKFVLDRLESTAVVTKEENRAYDEFGINLAETFDNSVLATEDRLETLKKVIRKKSKYDSEEIFLKKIGLDNIEYHEPQQIVPDKIDIKKSIESDAIVKYRIRKLKLMNLSNKDIDNKINEIINLNIQASVGKHKMNSEEQDILTRLRQQGRRDLQSKFQQKKQEAAHISAPIPEKEEKKVSPPPVVQEVKKKETPILQKPLLNNGPPLKKEKQLQRPIISLGDEEITEVKENTKPKTIGLSRPQLTIDDEPPKQEDTKQKIESEIANDPLIRRRMEKERMMKESMQISENKAVEENKKDEKIIKDNDGLGFGESLKDKMKARIGYEIENKTIKKQTPFEIASEKMKPPRR